MFAFEKAFPEIPAETEPALICSRAQEELVKKFRDSRPKAWEELLEKNLVFKRFGGHFYTKVTLFEAIPVTKEVIEIRNPDFDFSKKQIKITTNTVASYNDDFDFFYNNVFVIVS